MLCRPTFCGVHSNDHAWRGELSWLPGFFVINADLHQRHRPRPGPRLCAHDLYRIPRCLDPSGGKRGCSRTVATAPQCAALHLSRSLGGQLRLWVPARHGRRLLLQLFERQVLIALRTTDNRWTVSAASSVPQDEVGLVPTAGNRGEEGISAPAIQLHGSIAFPTSLRQSRDTYRRAAKPSPQAARIGPECR
jgi:hypothetical protein